MNSYDALVGQTTAPVPQYNLTNLPDGQGISPAQGSYTVRYTFLTSTTVGAVNAGHFPLLENYYADDDRPELQDFIANGPSSAGNVSAAVQTAVRTILKHSLQPTDSYSVFFGDVAKLAFTIDETTDPTADIAFGMMDNTGSPLFSGDDTNSLAYTEVRDVLGFGVFGDIWLNANTTKAGTPAWSSAAPGSTTFETLLHELGHSLGLKHPNASSHGTTNPDIDNQKYTVMTTPALDSQGNVTDYKQHPDVAGVALSGLQLEDIAAIQSIYGRNYAVRSLSGTVYKAGTNEAFGSTSTPFIYTIWDGGGAGDTISGEGYTSLVQIDLRQGHFSSIGLKAATGGAAVDPDDFDASGVMTNDRGNVAIAYHTVIENAKGTDAAGDILIGNDWQNRLEGLGGADILFGDGEVYDNSHGFTEVAKKDPNDLTKDFDPADPQGKLDPNRFKPFSDEDTLEGGTGADKMFGGHGNDLFIASADTKIANSDVTTGNLEGDIYYGGGWKGGGSTVNQTEGNLIPYLEDGIDTVDYSHVQLRDVGNVQRGILVDISTRAFGTVNEWNSVTGEIINEGVNDSLVSIESLVLTPFNDKVVVNLELGSAIGARELNSVVTSIKDASGTHVDSDVVQFLGGTFDPTTSKIYGKDGNALTVLDTINFSGIETITLNSQVLAKLGANGFVYSNNSMAVNFNHAPDPIFNINSSFSGGPDNGTLSLSTTVQFTGGVTQTIQGKDGSYLTAGFDGEANPPYMPEIVGSNEGDTFNIHLLRVPDYTFVNLIGESVPYMRNLDNFNIAIVAGLDNGTAVDTVNIAVDDAPIAFGYGYQTLDTTVSVTYTGGTDIYHLDEFYGGNFTLIFDSQIQKGDVQLVDYSLSEGNVDSVTLSITGKGTVELYGQVLQDLNISFLSGGGGFVDPDEGVVFTGVFDSFAPIDLSWADDTFAARLNFEGEIFGYGGNDVITANFVGNHLNGGTGNDTLNGGVGNDTLDAGDGNDTASGGYGNDSLMGGEGTDTLSSQVDEDSGHDFFDGGHGSNTYNLLASGQIASQVTIQGGTGEFDFDRANLSTFGAAQQLNVFANQFYFEGHTGIVTFNNLDVLNLGNDNTTVILHEATTLNITGGSGNNTFIGTDGIDRLTGGAGNDFIDALDDNDILTGGAGSDTIQGDGGDDSIFGGQADGNDIYDGGAGFDTLYLTGVSSNMTLNVSATQVSSVQTGTDSVASIESVVAGFGNDTVNGDASTSFYLSGFEGDDVVNAGNMGDHLFGEGGLDTLNGGTGNDVLDGGDGADLLNGGLGDDTYAYTPGTVADVVSDTGGADKILMGEGYALADLTFSRSGLDLELYFSGNHRLTLQNQFSDAGQVETVEFADGSTLNLANYPYTVLGTSGNDTITGTDAANVSDDLYGRAGDDTISGLAGNDGLHGEEGSDSLAGGDGNDSYFFAEGYGQDVITETAGALDQIILAASITPADVSYAQVGNDLLISYGMGSDSITVTGFFAGASGQIEQVVFADSTIHDVAYILSQVAPGSTLTGTAAADNLVGTSGNENIYGLGGIDTLSGLDGDDTLDGGNAADTMSGGQGNDTYIVAQAGDVVVENLNEGTDTVQAKVTWTLGANVENLVLTGIGNIKGFGNDAVNILTGNTGNNTLDGGLGADTMAGGLGNDTYYVDDAGDVFIENANEGIDTINIGVTHTLAANFENLVLTGTDNVNAFGNAVVNTLTGNAGNNTLDGGEGADLMKGGLGDDTYFVDNENDTITDTGGIDTVYTSVSYTLGGGIENLVLTGDGTINGGGNGLPNTITGNNRDNVLTGSGNADTLIGNGGNDTLIGGNGADTLLGGQDDDTYVITGASDIVTENSGQGTDTVESSVTYTLTANVENLVLTGTGDIKGFGNAEDNILTGNSGNNTLDGGAGKDTMSGGLGNDTYVVDASNDEVIENASEGIDTVKSSVTWTLGANFENLTLTGSNAIDGTGNAGNNAITGNSGANTLSGLAGDDVLTGQGAADKLYGGDDADTLYGAGGADTLHGDAGSDILFGQGGADHLYGEAGADIFAFQAATAYGASDTVHDFSLAEGDVLDLRDLLTGYDSLTMSLTDFVEITDSGANSLLKVDQDGAGTAFGFVQVATLTGVTGLTDEAALVTSGNLLAA